MKLVKRLFFIILCVLVQWSFAQEHTHRFYTVYDGLPQSQTQHIAQDSSGYIWVSTKGGVARFDGYEFETFTVNDGMLNNFVFRIVATDSCVWFFSTNGITCYIKNHFINYPYLESYIRSVYLWQNKFLLYTANAKLLFFEKEKYTEVNVSQLLGCTPFKNTVTNIKYVPADSSYLVVEHLGALYRVKNGIKTVIHEGHVVLNEGKPINHEVYYMVVNTIGLTSKFYCYHIQKHTKIPIKNEFVNDNNYIGIYSNGGNWLAKTAKTTGFLVNHTYMPLHKRFNLVSFVFTDKQQNLWVADEDGLYCFNKLEFIEYTQQNSGIVPSVWDVKEFPKGTYYFASFTNGLQKYFKKTFKTCTTFNNTYDQAQNSFYFNTPQASDTSIIFNHGEGVVSYDGKKFKPLIKDISLPFVGLATFYDSINYRWFAAGSLERLYVKDSINNTRLYCASDSTFTKNILAICYDRNNDICIGHKGLSKFKDGVFTPYPNIPDTLNWRVFSLQKDHHENLWIGTNNGLWFYNYDTIFQISTEYFKGNITFLKTVDTTWLMGGTTHGLPLLYLPDFYKTGEQRVKYYDRYNGFTGRDCGQNGTLHDSENTFWIPTIDRVLRLDATKIAFNKTPPKLVFKGIRLLGKNLGWTLLSDSINTFNYQQNGFKFSFLGLNFSAPERVRYKYRLLGYGNNWTEPATTSYAIFTNLKPGNYVFEVLASNEDDFWTLQPIKYSFKIIPAWWQRVWVQVTIGLFIALMITLSTIVFMKKKAAEKRKKLELQISLQQQEIEKQEYQKLYQASKLQAIREKIIGQEEERTRIARELHDGIGGTLAAVKMQMEHAINEPNPENMVSLVKIVNNTWEEVRTISHNLMPPQFSDVAINQVLANHIRELNKAKKINFSIQFLPQTGWDSVPQNIQVELYRMAQELCSNVVKYSNATKVEIQLAKYENEVNLTMEDNGSAFNYKGNGLGYRNIIDRLQVLGGRFEKSEVCNNGNTNGNTYLVQIPIKDNT